MRFAIRAILFGLWVLLLSSGCGGDVVYNPPPATSNDQASEKDGEALIYDGTGKAWDVTHAQKYRMVPSGFRFGLGPLYIRPIMNPQMLSPGDLNYPHDDIDDRVLGTVLNGFTRAYPIDILSRHEIANEQFGDAHVAVTYTSEAGLAAVYSREIDGKTLTLSASGWTYRNTFVLFDYETESMWYPLPGDDGLTCISGTYADRKLPELTSVLTRWNRWKADFPDSKFLKTD